MTKRRSRWRSSLAVVTAVVAGLWLARFDRGVDYARIQVASIDELERQLGALRVRLDVPGLAAAVAIGERVVWARGYGSANVERAIPVDAFTTSFHLASVTKPYAATLVLQLADEGRLDLQAPVSAFGIHLPASEPVRVWHLLSHTSHDKPGTSFRYDARRFGELTTVVERASGRPFAAALTERIIRPIGLEHTGPNPRDLDWAGCRARLALRILNMCGTEEQARRGRLTFDASGLNRSALDSNLAIGYARRWGRHLWPAGLFGSMAPEQHLTDLFASAGLVASAVDVARFSIALDSGKLLEPSTVARAFQPAIAGRHAPAFGLGWFLQDAGGVHLAWHFGQSFESSSLILKIPDDRITFVVLANADGLSRRLRLGEHGDVLASPAAVLFLNWYANGRPPATPAQAASTSGDRERAAEQSKLCRESVVSRMAETSSLQILQVVREPVLAGQEAAYKAVEDEIARTCVELNCPHPHLALESLSGPREIWWFNAYASEADRERVERAYAENKPLMAALERLSVKKRRFTGEGTNQCIRLRPGARAWTPAGARFVVIATPVSAVGTEAAIFDSSDGAVWALKAVASREEADSEARSWGSTARVFAVRPYWGYPAQAWLDADPEFWNVNPLASRR